MDGVDGEIRTHGGLRRRGCNPRPSTAWLRRPGNCGGHEGNRTPNLRFWRTTLCQLSYVPAEIWWRRSVSNRRHPACRAGALPTELHPHWSAHPILDALTNGAECETRTRLGGLEGHVSPVDTPHGCQAVRRVDRAAWRVPGCVRPARTLISCTPSRGQGLPQPSPDEPRFSVGADYVSTAPRALLPFPAFRASTTGSGAVTPAMMQLVDDAILVEPEGIEPSIPARGAGFTVRCLDHSATSPRTWCLVHESNVPPLDS